jgi:hypothetical protein
MRLREISTSFCVFVHRLLWAVFVFVFFICSPSCHAEIIAGFNIHSCVGLAELISIGWLDPTGKLIVTEDLFGTHNSSSLQLRSGQKIYEMLAKVMKSSATIEVVAFLRKGTKEEWDPVEGLSGIVGMDRDGVYIMEVYEDLAIPHQRSPNFTRSSFLEAIQQAKEFAFERRSILDQPSSAMRTRALLKLLLKLGDDFTFHQISTSLQNYNPIEEETILECLNMSQNAEEQVLLLRLVKAIPLSSQAFEQILSFTLRENAPIVRKYAFIALTTVDRIRA